MRKILYVIEENNILCILVTNIFTFTGYEIKGIRVCDITCLKRYLAGGSIDLKIIRNKEIVEKQELNKIYKGDGPDPIELFNFIKNPPSLENIIKNIQHQIIYIPIFNSEDKNKIGMLNAIFTK